MARGKSLYLFGFLFLFITFPLISEADVIINEIAWMGTSNSANDEWIELYNSGAEDVDLSNWVLMSLDEGLVVNFTKDSVFLPPVIRAGSFFLLERTDDTSVPAVAAQVIYTGSLGNSGEVLILKNAIGTEIDRVNAPDGWPAGDNETKQTMQRAGLIWITAAATPRAKNAAAAPPPAEEEAGESNETTESGEPTPPPVVQSSTLDMFDVAARAGEDITAQINEEIIFDAAGSSGAEEYIWYLGNGEVRQGKVVRYAYQMPGAYIVTLEVSQGDFKDKDQLMVQVFGGQIIINEIFVSANSSWVEFFNPTVLEIDLAGWSLEIGEDSFIFPANSVVAPNGFFVLNQSISKFPIKANLTLSLSFPDGALSDSVSLGEFPLGFSAARKDSEFFWASQPTPGRANMEPISNPSNPEPLPEPLPKSAPQTSPIVQQALAPIKEIINVSEIRAESQKNLAATASSSKIPLWLGISIVVVFAFLIGLFYLYFSHRRGRQQEKVIDDLSQNNY